MSLPAAFASKVTTEPTCHLWIGATNNKGYGILFIDGRHHLAHRLAYEAEYGPISDGMVLRTNAADLPERCPGHDREPIDRPEPLDVLPEYVNRHDCGKQKCEAAS